ncbi:hypothetical protein C8Q75DRAFT_503192 [Abortiporus biennis]|nr:hypothetical protein C8Q75DRAFT_503192 [Abortiporus biennis]
MVKIYIGATLNHSQQAHNMSVASESVPRYNLSRKSGTPKDIQQPARGSFPPKRQPDPNAALLLRKAQEQLQVVNAIRAQVRRPKTAQLLPDFSSTEPEVGLEAFLFTKRFYVAKGTSTPAAHAAAKIALIENAAKNGRTRYPSDRSKRVCLLQDMFYDKVDAAVLAAEQLDHKTVENDLSHTGNDLVQNEESCDGDGPGLKEVLADSEHYASRQHEGAPTRTISLKFGKKTLVMWDANKVASKKDEVQEHKATLSGGQLVFE